VTLRTEKFITRAMLRAEPNTLFVFGDNMLKVGRAGQAREMRGEPNAIGIPTKWKPSMDAEAFFTDRDYAKVRAVVLPIFEQLNNHLAMGGDVVWPEAGIGTGYAQLKQRAPRIYHLIDGLVAFLERERRLRR
jgi:hypothetical protein